MKMKENTHVQFTVDWDQFIQIDTALHLQMSLVFCPNIIMFFALVFWGVSEGSVNETVLCCTCYIVRPLMLLYTAPYKEQFTGKIKTLLIWSLNIDYISFTTVVYSVLFKSAWEKSLNYTASDRAMIIALFVIVVLLCLIYSINVLLQITVKLSQRINTILDVVASITLYVLPSLQFVLLFFTFGSGAGGFIIVAVLPVITSATRYNWNIVCGDNMGCSPLVRRLVWIVLMCFMNTVLIFFYITALEKENDRVGWACTIGFLQVIWTVWNCLWSFHDWGFTRITAVYVFGSVGVVVFSAVGLMAELILKTLNGEGLVGDLRIIVFSSESLFTALVVIIVILSPWIKKDLQCCQIPAKCKKAAPTESPQNQNAADAQEMNPLVNKQETDKNREADEPPHDSQT
ncbi:hypothetical protein E1301_Tti021752 [Triplophysa tibetana]|uniref:Uncharacterized protein n=1 Tax=Triplophysa tibetana TaxID=1572043 RepID=A0A5A9N8A6_9TELE|nr:hypothetical protein E1301_Tti021752 [Triplophysa tibetana]